MQKYLSLVKFSHTIFAMPFAITGFVIGSYMIDEFSLKKLLFIVICMITARNAAMAFNRYIDHDIDAKNVRTAIREIPSGIVSKKAALTFVFINSILFVGTTFFINSICFYLSPISLFIILGYSYTKRFSALCHIILGISLSLSPIGAFLAVVGSFHTLPILLGIVVLCWVSGFDIIYSLQDEKFDKENKLFSIPSYLGGKKALLVSRILHIISALILLWFILELALNLYALGYTSILAYIFFVGMLIYQHTLVKHDDLSKINLAFFTTNGIASIVFGILIITDIVLL
jgi:4-hydroxybenzoate polyprenyltransferase